MRVRFAVLLLGLISLVCLVATAAASADCVHVVAPGESLTSIAAADGLGIDQLAAANGLSPGAQLIAGTCLQIPPQGGPIVAGSAPATSIPESSSATSAVGGDGDNDSDDIGVAAPAPAPVSVGDGDGDGDDVGAAGSAAASTGGGGGSYVVQPGDTLTAIAARAGMTIGELAAANGIDPTAPLLSGTVLTLGGGSATVPVATTSASGGSYVVQPGDTLSAIAARAGMTLGELASLNGLDPAAPLLSGTVLKLSASAQVPALPQSSSVASSQPVGAAAQGSPVNPPYPTPEVVTPSQVGSIAAANGVPPALAEAVAYQESGFNNSAVSASDARGVMQILPGTWQYIQNALVPGSPPLAPASAADNIRGGVLLLRSLLNATGGNAALAAAGYYQGLPSVEANGMYSDTQQYVNDVMALESRFGG